MRGVLEATHETDVKWSIVPWLGVECGKWTKPLVEQVALWREILGGLSREALFLMKRVSTVAQWRRLRMCVEPRSSLLLAGRQRFICVHWLVSRAEPVDWLRPMWCCLRLFSPERARRFSADCCTASSSVAQPRDARLARVAPSGKNEWRTVFRTDLKIMWVRSFQLQWPTGTLVTLALTIIACFFPSEISLKVFRSVKHRLNSCVAIGRGKFPKFVVHAVRAVPDGRQVLNIANFQIHVGRGWSYADNASLRVSGRCCLLKVWERVEAHTRLVVSVLSAFMRGRKQGWPLISPLPAQKPICP